MNTDEASAWWHGPGDLVGIENLPAKLDAIFEMQPAIWSEFENLTSTSDEFDRQLAAACLARAQRLLYSMGLLLHAEIRDVVALPLRPIFENWITGLYVLNHPTAVVELTEKYKRERAKLGTYALMPLFQSVDPDKELELPGTEEMARRVTLALKANGAPYPNAPTNNYHLLFRGESGRSVHGGLFAVQNHLVGNEKEIAVTVERIEYSSGATEAILAATMVRNLAETVFERFGIPTKKLDEACAALTQPIDFTVGWEDMADGMTEETIELLKRSAYE